MKVEKVAEHGWLQTFVGEWKSVADMQMEPDGPVEHMEGTEHVRSMGGIWIVGEGRTPMPDGAEASTLLTLGFDPASGRFRGSWIGTMMTYMWVYDGTLDSATDTLILESTGPDCGGNGQMRVFQDRHRFLTPDHRVMSTHQQVADGSWPQLMEVHYHRTA